MKSTPSSAFSRPSKWRGLAYMVVASLLFSVMTVCVYTIGLFDPQLSALVVSFVRVLINLAVLAIPALLASDLGGLFGDFRPSLWLRGLFGTLALILSFASIQRIGPGESAFLVSGSGVFVALLGPLVLKQKNSSLVWLAIGGSMAGMALLFEPRLDGDDFSGRAMALGSGLLAALAYLMVAKAGRSNTPETVVFYFCLVAVIIHGAYFGYYGLQWPTSPEVWGLLVVGGLCASGAQLYMTKAYQMAPAALVSAVGYLSPVLSLAWGVLLFSRVPDAQGLYGCGLILLFGVMLPFLSGSGKGKNRA